MEAGTYNKQSRGLKPALLIAAFVLLVRLPFLNQAIQGDDVYYLASAEHAQIDPLHPNHVHYLFEGRDVDFRGYPHPPLNAWCLAGLIALFGDVREVPFHAAYISFSLIAAFAMWSLARRFSTRPLWATLLFLACPVFLVNGNSFESDIPFLAFWMSGIATFISAVDRRSFIRLAAAAIFLTLASLAAVQVVLAVPILAVYIWKHARSWRPAWATLPAPLLAIAAWQSFEWFSTGQFPAAVAAGYQQSYGYQRLHLKLRNAAALTVHSLFLIFPTWTFPIWTRITGPGPIFLLSWIIIFFAGALAFFFAGSARYLLPLVPPLAILASQARPIYLKIGFAAQLTFGLLLATVNYQHGNAYRTFARSLAKEARTHRVWVNAEWGLRHYLEAEGALPVHLSQQIPPGDVVVSSELAYPVAYSHGGSVPLTIAQQEIRPAIPLRLIGLESHSGYSTADKGFLPFGISSGPIDRIRAEVLSPKLPTESYVLLSAPGADSQILSGVYPNEGHPWRWMSKLASFLLKPPAAPEPMWVRFYIPDAAPARTVTLALNGREIARQTFPGPGTYSFASPPQSATRASAVLTISVDRSFSAPNDNRELGIILTGAGFQK